MWTTDVQVQNRVMLGQTVRTWTISIPISWEMSIPYEPFATASNRRLEPTNKPSNHRRVQSRSQNCDNRRIRHLITHTDKYPLQHSERRPGSRSARHLAQKTSSHIRHRLKSRIGKYLRKCVAKGPAKSTHKRSPENGPPYGPSPIQVYGNRAQKGRAGHLLLAFCYSPLAHLTT